MPRIRNKATGAVMTVSEATASALGSGWVDADIVERSGTPGASWKVAELKEYAAENGIDLGDATKKEDIVSAIEAASAPNE